MYRVQVLSLHIPRIRPQLSSIAANGSEIPKSNSIPTAWFLAVFVKRRHYFEAKLKQSRSRRMEGPQAARSIYGQDLRKTMRETSCILSFLSLLFIGHEDGRKKHREGTLNFRYKERKLAINQLPQYAYAQGLHHINEENYSSSRFGVS